MAKTYYSVLTQYGTQLITSAIAQKQPLQLLKMAIGDGNGQAITPEPSATRLARQVYSNNVSAISVDPRNNKQVIFELTIPETEGGFWIREIGLLDNQNRLVAYANCPESFKPKVSSGSGKVQVIRLILAVSSSEAFQLTVDNSVIFATKGQLTPKQINANTNNAVDDNGHTHAITQASTSEKGIVQLTNDTGLDSENLGLTAKAGKILAQGIAALRLALNNYIPNSKKSDSTTSNSSDTVATSKAAKTAYDKAVDANTNANGRVSKSGDTMTGDLTARNLNATSGVKSGYRVVVERNDPAYAPYINIYNKAVDLDTLSRIKDFAHLNFIVRRGENEKTKTRIGGRINPDKSSQLYLMASGADDVLKQNMVLFGQSGNVAIGKERDDGERLQVNGDISATKPINIKHKGWEKVRATHADGSYWRWETHPDGGSTDNSSRFNFVLTTARQETKYVSFPNVSGGSETVAYQSWVNNALGGKVNKAGDTMTGDLIVPYLRAMGGYISVSARDSLFAGLDIIREGSLGTWLSRIEALPDKRWKFWVQNSHDIFMPAKAGTVLLDNDITYQKIGDFEIRKYPDGTMIQTCRKKMLTGDYSNVNFNWAVAFVDMPTLIGTAQYFNGVGDHDSIVTFVKGTSNLACHLVCGETYNNNGEIAYVNVVAIGRWK